MLKEQAPSIHIEILSSNQDQKFVDTKLIPYLEILFEDLKCRSTQKSSGITLQVFQMYANMPYIISQYLFFAFKSNRDTDYISKEDFISSIIVLFFKPINEKISLIFKMYDFEQNGLISRENAKLLLSYIPIQKLEEEGNEFIQKSSDFNQNESWTKITIKDRQLFQNGIEKFIAEVFAESKAINLSDFRKIILEKSSEMLYLILELIFQNFPCSKIIQKKRTAFILQEEEKESKLQKRRQLFASINISTHIKSESQFEKVASPMFIQSPKLKKHILMSTLSQSPQNSNGQEVIQNFSDIDKTFLSPQAQFHQKEKFASQNKSPKMLSSKKIEKQVDLLPSIQKQKNTMFFNEEQSEFLKVESRAQKLQSPLGSPLSNKSNNSNKQMSKTRKIQQFLTNQNLQVQSKKQQQEQPKVQEKEQFDKIIVTMLDFQHTCSKEVLYQGEVLLQNKQKEFKPYHIILRGDEILCYKNKNKQEFKFMHTLVGTIIQQSEPSQLKLVYSKQQNCLDPLFQIQIILGVNRKRILYFHTQEEQQLWYSKLIEGANQKDLLEFIEIGEFLAKGSYGSIYKGFHKILKIDVAVKIIKKTNLTEEETQRQRKEIDVLKMCQHKNIIKLYNVFENQKYFYLVLEYLDGGDLFDYLAVQSHFLEESVAKKIFKELVEGVSYLQSLGIVHRDLKIENIMMTSKSENSSPKIIDFGLSTILTQNQFYNCNSGTIQYCSPENFLGESSNHQSDVWSLGVIFYRILGGYLPFDNQDKHQIPYQICTEELEMNTEIWKQISKEAIDLIKKMLEKDFNQRITIKKILNHRLFKYQQ